MFRYGFLLIKTLIFYFWAKMVTERVWLDTTADVRSDAVFLVMLGTSSIPAGHEVYGKTTEKLVPSCY